MREEQLMKENLTRPLEISSTIWRYNLKPKGDYHKTQGNGLESS